MNDSGITFISKDDALRIARRMGFVPPRREIQEQPLEVLVSHGRRVEFFDGVKKIVHALNPFRR